MLKRVKRILDRMGSFHFSRDIVYDPVARQNTSLRDRVGALLLCIHTGHGSHRALLIAQNILDDFTDNVNSKRLTSEPSPSMNYVISQLVFHASELIMDVENKFGDRAYITSAEFSTAIDKYMDEYFLL